jgi:epoxyqueuosine reductase
MERTYQEIFSEIFRKSPVKRTKFAGLKRNIEFLDLQIDFSLNFW